MDTKTKLLMSFKTDADDRVSLSVNDPRTDLTEAEIKTAMELIVEKNVFAPKGATIVSLVEAKVVQTDTTEYDLVIG